MAIAVPGDHEPSGDREDALAGPDPADELIGLDPHHPETRAFARHLERMRHVPANHTVEGYLRGIEDFADSANRTGGLVRWFTVTVVLLLLAGFAWSAYQTLGMVWTSLFPGTG